MFQSSIAQSQSNNELRIQIIFIVLLFSQTITLYLRCYIWVGGKKIEELKRHSI